MPPKKAALWTSKAHPDLQALLGEREVRVRRSGRQYFLDDLEPGYDRVFMSLALEQTSDDILQWSSERPIPAVVADAVMIFNREHRAPLCRVVEAAYWCHSMTVDILGNTCAGGAGASKDVPVVADAEGRAAGWPRGHALLTITPPFARRKTVRNAP